MLNLRNDMWNLSLVTILSPQKLNFNLLRASCKNSNELVLKLANFKGLEIPDTVDPEIKAFIQECCVFDRKMRPNAATLLKSTFLSGL